ncbi:MAG: hypothetical protein EA376_00925 [Phycisphaeraceae bacterium]|nr:MAG: hypothetical protein EA376_00925 [Phycisphaeraceae bacterium]
MGRRGADKAAATDALTTGAGAGLWRWLMVFLAGALCLVAVGVPAIGVVIAMLRHDPAGAGASLSETLTLVRLRNDGRLLARTIGVAILIGVVTAALAFPAAWSMRRLSPRLVALLVAPMLLPSYLVYASWGLLRSPGSWLGDVIARDAPTLAPIASRIQAVGGLSLWAWPVAAIVMGVAARRIDQGALDAMRLSSAPWWRRALMTLGAVRTGVIGAIGVTALLMIGSSVPLHVAEVETYAITIWRRLDETAGAPSVWWTASPLLLIALVMGWIVGGRVLGASSAEASHSEQPDTGVSRWWIAIAIAIWCLSTLAPLALFSANIREARALGEFWSLSSRGVGNALLIGAVVGVLGLFIAAGTSAGLSATPGSWMRRLTSLSLRIWLIGALIPGVLVGSAIHAASNHDLSAWLTDTRAGLALSHITRFGAVAALAGWWLAWMEPRELIDARRLAGPETLRSWLGASAPLQAGGLAAAAIGLTILSMHEIEATVMLAPPGHGNLAQHLLNNLHYLRVEELNVAGVYLIVGGLAIAATATLCAGRSARLLRRAAAPCLAALLCLVIVGCDDGSAVESRPINARAVLGEPGRSAGQFIYPRAITGDGERLWIVDRTGRVQSLTTDGHPIQSFMMPAFETGFPVGITWGPDGLLYIADTHQFRVMVFEPPDAAIQAGEAAPVRQWGEYGFEPGQFYYVTDVAIRTGADGRTPDRIYVGEYGGNDRISVFTGVGELLFTFGTYGSGEDAADIRFRRPQALLFDDERDELLIADSVNHRVGRFTPDGELIGWLGRPGARPGTGPGEFNYPYGLAMLPDRTLLVAEFGNSRIQRIDPASEVDAARGAEPAICLGLYGEPGRGDGQLAYPWGVTVIDGTVYALDSGNNRIIAFDPGRPRRITPRNSGQPNSDEMMDHALSPSSEPPDGGAQSQEALILQ